MDTPILLLTFNRPNLTRLVFNTIRETKPKRLYISSDGARKHVDGESVKVNSIREELLKSIDWECEVKTLFRTENLGCRVSVSQAITWFFDFEEMGIILEDDCLPSLSFFKFCEELLLKYKDDMRIWHISGHNHFPERVNQMDYYFSQNPHVWGWATWRSRWRLYDVNIKHFDESRKNLKYHLCSPNIGKFWIRLFSEIANIDTWDYQWVYCLLNNNGLSITPSVNLVFNIGFDKDATHTTIEDPSNSKNVNKEIDFPLMHPTYFMPNYNEDLFLFNNKYKPRFIRKVVSIINKIIRSLRN